MAARKNFTVDQGTAFDVVMTWRAGGALVNLTNYHAKMQIRPAPGNATLINELSTTNGKIALGGSAGTITLSIPYTETALFKEGGAVYDLILTPPNGKPFKLLYGTIKTIKRVTV